MWTSGLHEALHKRQFENIMVFFVVAYHAVLTSFRYLTLQANLSEFIYSLSHPQFHHEDHFFRTDELM